jgi:hypothetical protein
MGRWVDAKRRDGKAFKQWQRTDDDERAPERDDYCIFCGAEPYWLTKTRADGSAYQRSYIDHDPRLHRWTMRGDDDGSGERAPDARALPTPRRSYDDDDNEE